MRIAATIVLAGALMVIGTDVPRAAEVKEPAAEKARTDAHGDPLPKHARLRLGTVRFRQGGTIDTVLFLPDGKTIITDGNNGASVSRFWDAATGKERYSIPTVVGQTVSIISPDGQLVVDVENDQTLRVWDVATGKEKCRVGTKAPNGGGLVSPQFSPDSKTVAAIVPRADGATGAIHVWDAQSGRELRKLMAPEAKENETTFSVQTFRYSPRGKWLLVTGAGANNPMNVVWDATTGKQMPDLGEGLLGGGINFSVDDRYLARTVLAPGEQAEEANTFRIRLWDVATGKHVRDLGKFAADPGNVLFTRGGKQVATIEGGQKLHRWDLASGKEQPMIEAGQDTVIVSFATTLDGKTLALGTADGTIKLYAAETGKELHSLSGYQPSRNGGGAPPPGASNPLEESIDFSSDGKLLVAAGGHVVRLWDVETGKDKRPSASGHEGAILSIAMNAERQLVATLGTDGAARLWHAATGKEVARIDGPKLSDPQLAFMQAFGSLAIAPHGDIVAIAWPDGTTTLYDVPGKQVLRKIENTGTRVLFAPGGKTLISGDGMGRVFLWDVRTGKQLRQLAGAGPNELAPEDAMFGGPGVSLALSPDGKTLATADMGMDGLEFGIRLWELSTGKQRRHFRFKSELDGSPRGVPGAGIGLPAPGVNIGGISGIAFSPDGKTLAWSTGGSIRLCDLAQGKEIRRFGGQEGAIAEMAFSPGGKYLAAASDDGTLQVWETATGTALGQLTGHRGPLTALVFAPDGKTLITGGVDTTILYWDMDAFLAEERAPRAKLTV
ncbi:MAG: WD40 repeat domain-containing protein, partial [Gemmataceae bacterium]|nr:WD40 repeat domain-containing protein [Gemmataceae bacterium]